METGHPLVKAYERILGQGKSPIGLIKPECAKARLDDIFQDGDWTGVTCSTWSPEGGYADGGAVARVIRSAIKLGVWHIPQAVTKLDFDGQGDCSGFTTENGTKLTGEKVILCTGAHTPSLLATSAPKRPEIHAGHRMVATGLVSGTFHARKPSTRVCSALL